MNSIPWGIILPVLVIQLILLVVAVMDLVKAESTRGPKLMWVFLIVLGGIIGPVAYFIAGRRNS